MSKKVSLKDIAGEVGVSISLVSYVLNNKKKGRVHPDTAKKIVETAKKRNYVPNQIAKSLKSSKTFTIGLIVADISNFFYSYIARYIEDAANESDYNVLYGSAYEDPIRFQKILNVMIARQVDGLILAIPEGAEECIRDLQRIKLPFVVIDRVFPGHKNYTSFSLDNYKASKMVVDEFIKQKAKRIGAIGLKTKLHHLAERRRGFIETAKKTLPPQHIFSYEVEEKDLERQVEEIVQEAIFENKVDGLCFFTNKIAMAALPYLNKHRVKVPEEVKVICFDEAEAYRLFPHPLTYVKQPLEEMSKAAVKFLIDETEKRKQLCRQFDAVLVNI